MSVSTSSVAVPAVVPQIKPGGHAHEGLDLLQTLHGVHHLVARFVLFDEPIDESVNLSPVFRTNVGGIVAEVVEVVVLLEHRGFIDVVVGGDTMLTGIFGQPPDVLHVVAANVDVEKDEIAVDALLAQDVFQVLLGGNQCLRQARLQIPRVQREVEHGYARVAETVCEIGAQQTPIGRDVNPEPFFRRVVDDLATKSGRNKGSPPINASTRQPLS